MALEVRAITPEELEGWITVTHSAFHATHTLAEEAAFRRSIGQPGERTRGAFDDGRLVGTIDSFACEVTLPGGARLSADAITSASVLPTHRRRGLLTRMVKVALQAAHERGDQSSLLVAAEYPIYGRFGYGPVTEQATYELTTSAARFVRRAPGQVNLVEARQMREHAPRVFEAMRASWPGQIARRPHTWDTRLGLRETPWEGTRPNRFALYCDERGEVQGYLLYSVDGVWDFRLPHSTLEVTELIALTPDAYVGLWQYCAEVDLVSTVRAGMRCAEEAVPWLLENPRAAWRRTESADLLWLRPLDVAASLAARTYSAEGELSIEVYDPLGLSGGRFLLQGGPHGATCSPSTRSADISLSMDVLASVLLGHARPRVLADAARIDESRPRAVDLAERMFHSPRTPWCSTFF